uniref:C2H2-type domain-containing protein n=1 Tax=Stomoxys calcitrans TaxID=35570 RepID=A0A1I8Q143_STOCA
MNETNFATYDSYFGSTNFPISSVESELMDYDLPPQNHYLNNMPCDLPPASSSVEQRHSSQTNVFPYLSHTREEQDRLKDSSSASSAPTTNGFSTIPFVQIHTTDVQPPHRSYGNVFRRNISRQEEIKSEPIKSESSEASKDRTNATPTPPRVPSATQQIPNENTEDQRECEEEIFGRPSIHKCSICPYISLRESERNDHERLQHSDESKKQAAMQKEIKCPGCNNIFFAQQSLEIHLKLDHLVPENEISKFVKYMENRTNEQIQKVSKATNESDENVEPPRKSRIYLKNVECLREPNRQPIEQTENQLSGNGNNKNNHGTENRNFKPPKQKISIKSVDVLREPALLRRDYELGSVNFNSYNGSGSNHLTPLDISNRTHEAYNPSRKSSLQHNTCNNVGSDNSKTSMAISNSVSSQKQTTEKPRKPKIYVKSVESFNLMPLEALHSANSDFIGSSSSTTNQNYDSNFVSMPYIYETNANASSANAVTNNTTFLNGHQVDAAYQIVNDPTQNTSGYIMDNSLYMTNMSDTNATGGQVESLSLVTENTSPSVGAPHHHMPETDNFVNKAMPICQEQHRGTLHLRTVDELNLLVDELNEVQHLIAPNLDNNHSSETLSSTINMNGDGNLIGDSLYETESFKFQDLDSQMANDWAETYEDLAVDISGIITDVANHTNGSGNKNDENEDCTSENNQKNTNTLDIDTPQVSLITIRDIEELTGGSAMAETQYFINYSNDNNGQEFHTATAMGSNSSEAIDQNSSAINLNSATQHHNSENAESLKRELSNATPESKDSSALKNSVISNPAFANEQQHDGAQVTTVNTRSPQHSSSEANAPPSSIGHSMGKLAQEPMNSSIQPYSDTCNTSSVSLAQNQHSPKSKIRSEDLSKTVSASVTPDLPPLVPVTKFPTQTPSNVTSNDIPTLIPLPPLIKINKALAKEPTMSVTNKQEEAPVIQEKGRIYVANNLMEPPKKPVSVTSGTSVRGRPFGGRRVKELKPQQGIAADESFVKCSVKGCAFRFKRTETLEYHQKCHDTSVSTDNSNLQAIICPECKSPEFNNWNTLHTHLWRAHQIDMELYKCELCDFKTPIFSRLVNTHAKIHFDDRSYKCEQCGKGFKNSKQLKNHRRWHRVQVSNSLSTNKDAEAPPQIHRCPDCGSTFKNFKTLKDHCNYCKNGESSLKCDICQKTMSTKASLKLHLLMHSDSEKRFKCQQCDYATNDHNAFRRHRMGHENKKMYECQFCDYKSVQSVTYQKHIRHKHPDKADSVIHKCNHCPFTTINRSLLVVHQAKHHKQIISGETVVDKTTDTLGSSVNVQQENTIVGVTTPDVQKSKIKVKSNLFTL